MTTNIEAVERLTEAAKHPHLRIEFGVGFGTKGSIITATLSVPNGHGRYMRVKPFLTASSHEELLDSIKALMGGEVQPMEES